MNKLTEIPLQATISVPSLYFEAALSRGYMTTAVTKIDQYLDELCVSTVVSDRLSLSHLTVMEMSEGLETSKDRNSILSDICYNFVYAFAKEHAMTKLIEMYGFVGMVEDSRLVIFPCATSEIYENARKIVKDKEAEMDNYPDSYALQIDISNRTIH